MEIPNVDDHVSKLEHMGKETVKKLQDIRTAAIQASVEINVPVNCILKGKQSINQSIQKMLTLRTLKVVEILWLLLCPSVSKGASKLDTTSECKQRQYIVQKSREKSLKQSVGPETSACCSWRVQEAGLDGGS